MSFSTSKLGLRYLSQHQIGKDAIINDNIDKLDSIIWLSAKSMNYTAPTESAKNGDSYIIPQNATNEWSNLTNQIALHRNNKWEYYIPEVGYSIYVQDKNMYYAFNGEEWIPIQSSQKNDEEEGIILNYMDRIGIKTDATTEDRLFVKSPGAYFINDGDIRVKLSKNNDGSVASVGFYDNYQIKAEVGIFHDNQLKFYLYNNNESIETIVFDSSGRMFAKNGLYLHKGIQFEGSNDQLNDYCEGTWTPSVVGETKSGSTSYVYQNGNFIKIGKMVFVDMFIRCNSLLKDALGPVAIDGLPFLPSGSISFASSIMLKGITNIIAGCIPNIIKTNSHEKRVNLFYTTQTGCFPLEVKNIGSNFEACGSFSYRID